MGSPRAVAASPRGYQRCVLSCFFHTAGTGQEEAYRGRGKGSRRWGEPSPRTPLTEKPMARCTSALPCPPRKAFPIRRLQPSSPPPPPYSPALPSSSLSPSFPSANPRKTRRGEGGKGLRGIRRRKTWVSRGREEREEFGRRSAVRLPRQGLPPPGRDERYGHLRCARA